MVGDGASWAGALGVNTPLARTAAITNRKPFRLIDHLRLIATVESSVFMLFLSLVGVMFILKEKC